MKPHLPTVLSALALSAATLAQVAPPAPPTAAAKKSADVVALNPFEVKAEADNSYGALNSNSLTQFNTALHQTPVSADIFTAEFMRDIAVTSVEEMLNGYGAGAGTVMSNPDADALNQQPGDRTGIEGLLATLVRTRPALQGGKLAGVITVVPLLDGAGGEVAAVPDLLGGVLAGLGKRQPTLACLDHRLDDGETRQGAGFPGIGRGGRGVFHRGRGLRPPVARRDKLVVWDALPHTVAPCHSALSVAFPTFQQVGDTGSS